MLPPPPTPTLFPYTTLFRPRPPERAPGRHRGRPSPPRPAPRRRQGRRQRGGAAGVGERRRSEEHTSELQSHSDLVCRLLLEKKTKCLATDLARAMTIEKDEA